MLKVRCDKQKPRCERCEAANGSCVYGPYRWKGRPAASTTSRISISDRSTKSTTPIETSTVIMAARSGSSSPIDGWDQTVTVGSLALESQYFAPPMNFQDARMELHWEDMMPSANAAEIDGYSARYMELDQDTTGKNSADDDSGIVWNGSSGGRKTASSLPGDTAPSSSGTSNRSDSPYSSQGTGGASTRCRCSSLVFNLLQDMYHAESPCRLRTTPGNESKNSDNGDRAIIPISLPRPDRIIKINHAAVQHMEQLLSCDCAACADDPTLLFLVTALSSKLLAWYRAVFSKVAQQQSQSPLELDPGLGIGMIPEEGDLLGLSSILAVQVGDFHLDFGSEQRLKAQFLLCEVQRLGQVLDLLGARAISRVPQHDASAEASKKLPISAVHQFLAVSLDQLTLVMKEYCVS